METQSRYTRMKRASFIAVFIFAVGSLALAGIAAAHADDSAQCVQPNSVELPSERTHDPDAHFGDMNYERFAQQVCSA